MNVILTPAEHAEVLRQMPGPIYLTVEGDRRGKVSTKLNYVRTLGYALSAEFDWYAPSRFVEATGPCETCDETAARLHDAYEEAAARHGWSTQTASRKPWSDVPESNKATMRDAIRAVFGCPSCEGTGTKVLTVGDVRLTVVSVEPNDDGRTWIVTLERLP